MTRRRNRGLLGSPTRVFCLSFLLVALAVPGIACIRADDSKNQKPTNIAAESQPQPQRQQQQRQASPQDVYHVAWDATRQMFYDTGKLAKWNELVHKYCPEIKNDEDAVKFANKALETLDDPFTVLHTPKEVAELEEQKTGIMAGIGVQWVGIKKEADGKTPVLSANKVPFPNSDKDGNPVIGGLTDGGPAKEAGLQKGDALVSVNGTKVAGLDLDQLKKAMKDKAGTTAKLVYRRDGKDVSVDIVRRELKVPTPELPTRRFGDGKIGYIFLPSFVSNHTVKQLETALSKLSDCDAYILDERHNLGGQVNICVQTAGLFMDKGVVTKTRKRVPRAGMVSTEFRLTDKEVEIVTTIESTGETLPPERMPRPRNMTGKKPLVLITDNVAMSASEMLAGALKDSGAAILVGEKTWGKGVGQEVIPLLNGTALRVTNTRFFTPNGTWPGDGHKERHGITPHHEVKLSNPDKVFGDEDEQLNFAIKLLSDKLAAK